MEGVTGIGGFFFRGEISVTGGGTYLDQTIFTPLPDGFVRQKNEIYTDSGVNWSTLFDENYVIIQK